MGHVNIEIKARCNTPDKVRSILQEHNADFKGEDHQIDTYFNCNHGRMKLREGTIENNLIHYSRNDTAGAKQSNVILFTSDPSSSLKELLVAGLGVHVVVDKKREIYFIDNVKFHIDSVKELGSFVEIEAIDVDGTFTVEKLREQCNHYIELLGIASEDLLETSYSDMLMK